MPYPTIQSLPPAPQRGEAFETFAQKANDHAAALTPWTDDVNAAGAYIDDATAGVAEDRQAAETAATSAESNAAIATSAANFKGAWADLTGSINVPSSVYHAGGYWQLLNDLADVTFSEPGVSGDWSSTTVLQGDATGPISMAGFAFTADSLKAERYDLASAATTDTLDLAQSNVFRVDASVARTLAFANAPGANRAMTVVVHITDNSAVTWPAGIDWDSDAAPELGDNETKVVLFWDGLEWSGFVRVAK